MRCGTFFPSESVKPGQLQLACAIVAVRAYRDGLRIFESASPLVFDVLVETLERAVRLSHVFVDV